MSELLTGYQTVTPAYGRDYKSAASIAVDLQAGKDFNLQTFNGSGYVSLADFAVGAVINVRYQQNRKVTPFKVTGPGTVKQVR